MISNTYEVLGALPRAHPIKCLMSEHELLLARLDELERLARPGVLRSPSAQQLDALESIVHFLIASEPHHQREEQALFPLLRSRGVEAAADAMVAEHDEIRVLQQALLAIVERLSTGGESVRGEFERSAAQLLSVLRDHVAKEDYILYPLAIELIDDADVWREVTERGATIASILPDADADADEPCAECEP